jgi:hypothetical protein
LVDARLFRLTLFTELGTGDEDHRDEPLDEA